LAPVDSENLTDASLFRVFSSNSVASKAKYFQMVEARSILCATTKNLLYGSI